jgi:hypothetical protein
MGWIKVPIPASRDHYHRSQTSRLRSGVSSENYWERPRATSRLNLHPGAILLRDIIRNRVRTHSKAPIHNKAPIHSKAPTHSKVPTHHKATEAGVEDIDKEGDQAGWAL